MRAATWLSSLKTCMSSDSSFSICKMIICVLVVWMNMLAYMTIHRLANFKTTFGTLLKAYTMADIMFGLCCLTDSFRLMGKPHIDVRMCNTLSYVINISLGISIITLTCISWDRFYARTYPNHYRNVMKRRKVFIIILISYILCALCFLPSLRGSEVDGDPPKSCITHWQDYSSLSFFVIFLLMIGNLTTTAMCCLFTLKRSVNEGVPKLDKPHQCSTSCSCDFDKISSKVFLGVTIMFYIMWFPFITVTFILIFTDALISIKLINLFFNIGLASSVVKLPVYIKWLPVFGDGFLDLCTTIGTKCYNCVFPERVAEMFVTDRINNNIARFNSRLEPGWEA